MWSHLSHVVTLVTGDHTDHMWSHLSHEINISTADQNVHLLYDHNDEHAQRIDLRGRR